MVGHRREQARLLETVCKADELEHTYNKLQASIGLIEPENQSMNAFLPLWWLFSERSEQDFYRTFSAYIFSAYGARPQTRSL